MRAKAISWDPTRFRAERDTGPIGGRGPLGDGHFRRQIYGVTRPTSGTADRRDAGPLFLRQTLPVIPRRGKRRSGIMVLSLAFPPRPREVGKGWSMVLSSDRENEGGPERARAIPGISSAPPDPWSGCLECWGSAPNGLAPTPIRSGSIFPVVGRSSCISWRPFTTSLASRPR